MTLQDAVKSRKQFKRKEWSNRWIVRMKFSSDEDEFVEVVNDKIVGRARLCIDDIFADDWETCEEWYEGDFQKKYPNGVVCWVWNKEWDERKLRIVRDYKEGGAYNFETNSAFWRHAKPVKPDEAPAIIGE